MSLSAELFARAQNYIPGGVNSPVRAFKGVDGTPLFFERGAGAYLIDVDNKQYIDYIGSWGPLIVGHSHPYVIAAIEKALHQGLSFGAPTPIELQMAEKITQLMPNLAMLRLVSSGTEATMTAIRLARGYTGRDKIIKFNGCYHGHSDSLLVKAGSGALTLGVPSSPGIPASFAEHTLVAEYNDLASVEKIFAEHGQQIAAIIVEPVAGNMGCVLPEPGFLQGLRKLCDDQQSLLIFDEVMTGFRVALGGAQTIYSITPDLTTLGKVIGGGLPVAAIGGPKHIMGYLAPVGPVYQAGTLSGNPIALAAGLATLELISEPGFYSSLSVMTQKLTQGIAELAEAANIPLVINTIGGMFGLFFTEQQRVTSCADVNRVDVARFKRFFHGMLERGIYLAPSAYEAGFVSSAHQHEEIDLTLAACEQVFSIL